MPKSGNTIDAITRLLEFLENRGILPMREWRKKNMSKRLEIELELDAQKREHNRIHALKDAETQIAIDMAKDMASLNGQKPGAEIKDREFKLRTVKNLLNDALATQYSKDRIGLYALGEMAANGKEGLDTENPGETWTARFFKYAADIRDDDIRKLWGKILAGEFCRPGSFSLRTLEVLHNLDQKDAELFLKFAPYVMNSRYFPQKALDLLEVGTFHIYDLASTGLVIAGLNKTFEDRIIASNRWFVVQGEPEQESSSSGCHLEAIFLSDAGREIYGIIPVDFEASKKGAEFFAQCADDKFKTTLRIDALPECRID